MLVMDVDVQIGCLQTLSYFSVAGSLSFTMQIRVTSRFVCLFVFCSVLFFKIMLVTSLWRKRFPL